MANEPHARTLLARLGLANAAPRCGARRKFDDGACQQPAMRNGRRCRLHGGMSTGPRTPEGLERSRTARLKHGFYSAEAIEKRRAARESARLLRDNTRELRAVMRVVLRAEREGELVSEDVAERILDLCRSA